MSNRLLLGFAALSTVLAIAGVSLLLKEEEPAPSVRSQTAARQAAPPTVHPAPSEAPVIEAAPPSQALPPEAFDEAESEQTRQALIAERIEALDLQIEAARAEGEHDYADAMERRIQALAERAEEGSEGD